MARRHHTDGGGDSDHVFALCSLLGFQFAPRIPDLKSRRLYSFSKASAYPSLEPLIAARINVALIRAHWLEILRVAASIRTGTVTASLILRQLASYPRQNGLAAALRELGRLERTLFTLDWLEDAELRRQTSQELNKGETRNSLARAVFIHRLGEIRDRTYENQQHRASGLNPPEQRARQIAQALYARGVKTMQTAGFGRVAPVACNTTPEGQQKNRRVEIWLH